MLLSSVLINDPEVYASRMMLLMGIKEFRKEAFYDFGIQKISTWNYHYKKFSS
jgi:hypothetical protein